MVNSIEHLVFRNYAFNYLPVQVLADGSHSFLQAFFRQVNQMNIIARQGKDMRDSIAHRA